MKKENSKFEGWIFCLGLLIPFTIYITFDYYYIPKIQTFLFDFESQGDWVIARDISKWGTFLYLIRLIPAFCFILVSIGFHFSDRKFISYYKIPLSLFLLWVMSFFFSLQYWVLFQKDFILVKNLFHKTKYQYKDITKYEVERGSKFAHIIIYFSTENMIRIALNENVLKLIKENKKNE